MISISSEGQRNDEADGDGEDEDDDEKEGGFKWEINSPRLD